MPKKFFKRIFPSQDVIRRIPLLPRFTALLKGPNAWHMNRRSVARAALIGIFSAFLPVPFQMVIAAFLALNFRANIPIAVGLVWISNPITIPPIFYATYQLGTLILDTPSREFSIQLSLEWFFTELINIWQPMLVGSLVAGIIFAIIGYISVRIMWRVHVVNQWRRRSWRRNRKVEP